MAEAVKHSDMKHGKENTARFTIRRFAVLLHVMHRQTVRKVDQEADVNV